MSDTFNHNSRLVSLVDEDEEGTHPVTVGPDGIEQQAIEERPTTAPHVLLETLENLSNDELRARLLEPLDAYTGVTSD